MQPPKPSTDARAELAVAAIFVAIIAWQWNGPGHLPGTDSMAYIIGGITLVTTGAYLSPAGEPQLWFPPLFPILIGIGSLGGRVDPATTAHVIAAASAVFGLFLTGRLARLAGARGYEPALAMALLALNPIHQGSAVYALSETTATLFALAAFAVWLQLADRGSTRGYVFLGLLVGLSYLTRPEALLFLPLWAAVDMFQSKTIRPVLGRYALAGAVAALVASPYVLYLSMHTGELTLTGKTAINLASGRGSYYGQPTEYIDPSTLEMGLWNYTVSFQDEVRRCLWNAARLLASYARHLGAILALPILLGLVSFIKTGRLRFLFGGAAFVAYLLLLVIFPVKNRYLHLSVPFLSILAARGLTGLLDFTRQASLPRWRIRLSVVLAAAIGVGVIVQSMAVARRSVVDATGLSLLRDAGVHLGRLDPAGGVVYDLWGHVGFHSRKETRVVTQNDAQTILRYIDKHARPGQTVYLSVSTMESPFYHPSLRNLLQTSDAYPQLQRLFSLTNEDGTVVVYLVRARQQGSIRAR